MMKIERYEMRLRSLYFKRRFQERADEVLPGLNSLYLACQEVKGSAKLRKILEVVLSLGNYMNGGTNRGGAYGFKVSFLLKLVDTKGQDTRFTFLHFVHKVLEKAFPGTEDLRAELPHIEAASKINMANLIAETNELRAGIASIEAELPNHKEVKKGDNFYQVMTTFLERAKKTFETLDQKMTLMTQSKLLFFSLSLLSFFLSSSFFLTLNLFFSFRSDRDIFRRGAQG